MPVGHLYALLGKMSVQSLCSYSTRAEALNRRYFLMLSYICSLYILHINPLLDIAFATIFSDSVGSVFVLLTVCFTVQKF